MKFNKSKSMLIFHTHYNKWNNVAYYQEIKVVKHTKVLGYILDQKLDNKKNIEYI